MIYRILLTGAREWAFANTIHEALLAECFRATKQGYDAAVLIHGDCRRGADAQADMIWTAYTSGQVPLLILDAERYPGDEFPTFKDRNQFMVDQGAQVCLSFAVHWASGTGQCARMARRADIRVRDYGVDTA